MSRCFPLSHNFPLFPGFHHQQFSFQADFVAPIPLPVSKYLSQSFVPPVNKRSHPLPSLTLSPKLISGNNWEAEEGAGAGEEGAAKQRVLFKSFLFVGFHSEFQHSHTSPGFLPSPGSHSSPGSHPSPGSHFSQTRPSLEHGKSNPRLWILYGFAINRELWGGFSMRC